jgi:transcriptional regulator with XRE-family HTH domain
VVLGKRLQELREAAGLKREEAAQALRVAPATVRRMEMADVALKIPYVQVLLEAYGVPEDEANAFVELAEEANQPGRLASSVSETNACVSASGTPYASSSTCT